MKWKYYEIICDDTVIGVCSDSGDGENLLHATQEDHVSVFGEISREDFDRYGDDDWEKPLSKERWVPKITVVLELENAKS